MPYVMVPVPDEHVEAVMQFVLRAVARAAEQPWDAESVAKLFNEIDEASRSLLAFVARASVEDRELDTTEAARLVQLTPREVVGIANELSSLARDEDRPAIVKTRGITTRLANGRVTERRVLQMEPEVADFVREAEKAELAGAPHPLGEAHE